MSPDALLWFCLGPLRAVAGAALGTRSLRQFSRRDLEEICRRKEPQQRFGQILRLHDRVVVGVEHFLAVAAVLLGAAASLWLARQWPRWAERGLIAQVAGPAVLVGILLITGLWLPRAIARLWAEPFLFHTWRIWRVVSALMTPLVWGGQLVDGLLHRLAGRAVTAATEESLEEEIRTIVTEGHREGLLEEEAREMIEGVMELHDADVAEIMTPRTDVQMIDVNMPWDKMLEYVIAVGHTRIPVFRKNRDDIIGILYSKDLLPELAKGPDQARRPFNAILRKPYFVPETKAVDDLLQEFQQTRNHVAVVLDEYGGVSGLVTIEDVLEEIVGEIVDEYDEDLVEEIEQIDERTFEALGRAHVDQINEAMGITLPESDDFDTIGGFVFSQLGHVPSLAESLVWNDCVRITVLDVSRRRIDRLRLEILDPNLLDQRARESA
ncbi:MAG: hypothetical protein A2W31_09020 [Planctomycetes bacterium RBG_16_64_10]|nr:MAG: hypothetical protein A2W31_09020 [Planctomycetes bacterium RBG_16_64_10]